MTEKSGSRTTKQPYHHCQRRSCFMTNTPTRYQRREAAAIWETLPRLVSFCGDMICMNCHHCHQAFCWKLSFLGCKLQGRKWHRPLNIAVLWHFPDFPTPNAPNAPNMWTCLVWSSDSDFFVFHVHCGRDGLQEMIWERRILIWHMERQGSCNCIATALQLHGLHLDFLPSGAHRSLFNKDPDPCSTKIPCDPQTKTHFARSCKHWVAALTDEMSRQGLQS